MAKIKLSSVGITNISGKAGGSIYSRNRGGAYVKNFAVPTNPNTAFQQHVRSLFGGIAQAWRTLTEEQRNSFTEMAPLYTAKDVFGDGLTYTGSQLHQKLNGNLQLNNQSAILMALPPQGTPPLIEVAGSASLSLAGDFSVTLSPSFTIGDYDPADFRAVVSMAPPSSPSRLYQKNKVRLISSSALSVSGTVRDQSSAYVDRFFEPVAGQSIFIQVQIINIKTGEISVPITEAVIVEQLEA